MITPQFTCWGFYCVGILMTLSYKLGRYVREGRKQGKRTIECVGDWFFDTSLDNVVSWGATVLNFSGAFVLGAIYIDKLPIPGLGWVVMIPLHWAFALFLGSLSEFVIPNAAKTIANKISSMIGG